MTEILLMSACDFSEIFGNVVSRWYYYAVLLAVIIALTLFFLFRKKRVRNNLSRTEKLVYASLFTALSAVANIFSFFIVPNRYAITFTAIPCFLAGYLLGAKCGFIVGFAGDLIGCVIAPSGAYLPLIGLSSGLLGFIPGIIFEYARGNDSVLTVISFSVCYVVCSAFLNTFANWLFIATDLNSTTTFWAYFVVRFWFQAIVMAVNCAISVALVVFLKKRLPDDKFRLNCDLKEDCSRKNDE